MGCASSGPQSGGPRGPSSPGKASLAPPYNDSTAGGGSSQASQSSSVQQAVPAKSVRDSALESHSTVQRKGEPGGGGEALPSTTPSPSRASDKVAIDEAAVVVSARDTMATALPPNGLRGVTSHESASVSQTAGAPVRTSAGSAHAATGTAAARASSARSSFALDAMAATAMRKKHSHEPVKKSNDPAALQPDVLLDKLPQSLLPFVSKLVVLPADTPVPATTLQKLWGMVSLADAVVTVGQCRAHGILRVATLDDGTIWCMVGAAMLERLQELYGEHAGTIHAALIDAYTWGQQGQALQLRDVPDDGYILQQMSHHLLACGRGGALRTLLGEPSWLEAKLQAYGTAPVVSDFRKYLLEFPEDSGARLLLQAFQLSLGCCVEQQGGRLLREQMLARLMAVAQREGSSMPASRTATACGAVDGSRGAGGGERSGLPGPGSRPEVAHASSPTPLMVVSNGDDTDTGLTGTGLTAITAHTTTGMGTGLSIPPLRDSARFSCGANASLREWFEYQSSRAAMDLCSAAGYGIVHLLPRSASLKQAGGIQRMILRGHTAPIRKVVISPNGQDVLTVSEDGTAQVWDMNVGDCVMQLARQVPLTDVCVAPDGGLCVVTSKDGAACVWDLSTGAVQHLLQGHTERINSVAIDRAGLRCVTASDDRTVRVWNIEQGQCDAVLNGHGKNLGGFGLVFDVALSGDGEMAATASEDFTARVWDLTTFKCIHVLEGHSGWVVSVTFVGDTTRIISASHDCTARVWDSVRGCCVHVLQGHTARLSRVRADAAGVHAVTCSDDGSARVWDIETGKCISVLKKHVSWVSDATLSRTGERCVTVGGDGLVCLWDAMTGELQAALEGHTQALHSVVLTSGTRFAVTAGDDGTARVWDLGSNARISAASSHTSRIRGLRALQGGRQVVSSCEDGELVVWDVASCKPLHTLTALTGAAAFLDVSVDGARVVAGTTTRQVCCWGIPAGDILSSLPQQQGSRVKDMAVSAAGNVVAVVLYDSTASVWDLNTGKQISQLIGRGERVGRNVHAGGVNGILLCGGANGAATAVTWSKDCTARVWDVNSATVRAVLEGHTDGIRAAALSLDQTVLATASYGTCVRLHILGDGSPLAVLDHAASASHLSFSPDGRYLAVGLENHTVVVWDLVAHSCLPPMTAHKSDITALTYSPDSAVLATCSQDCTVRVWDARNGRQIAFFVADAPLTGCCFAGGLLCAADILVVGDAGGAVHFLDLPSELQPEAMGLY